MLNHHKIKLITLICSTTLFIGCYADSKDDKPIKEPTTQLKDEVLSNVPSLQLQEGKRSALPPTPPSL